MNGHSNGEQTPSTHSDILIVGAGTFGASTAYHLSRTYPSPAAITLIDRSLPHHVSDRAASNDINKIIRADYSTPFYMDLGFEALEAWNTWPELKGKGYYHRTGWVHLNKKGHDLGDRIRKAFRERGQDPTSDIALEDVRTRFGGILNDTNMDGLDKAYWNPLSGWCDAASATSEIIQTAIENGIRHVSADVMKLHLGPAGVKAVETDNGEIYSADKILIATGAWTSALMTAAEDELNLDDGDRVESQIVAAGVCVAHFQLTEDEVEELKEMPVIIYSDKGDIQPPPRNNILKMTNAASFTNYEMTPSGHRISRPPTLDQFTVPKKLKDETIEKVTSKVLPQYTNREVAYWRQCWDAVSPSQDHLITQHPHPQLNNLYLAVGGSLHSYKFLPTIGKYVTNVLLGKSNGKEKDDRWAWKRGSSQQGKGAHEKAYPTRELADLM